MIGLTGRPLSILAVAAALAAAALWMGYLAVYQVDDAYIVYRYADNLAHGQGFVFNAGERVEGVTCFLWALCLVPFAAAGLPLPIVGPILTALAGLSTLALLPGVSARVSGRPGAPDGWDFAAPVLLAAYPAFAYWSVGALETVPYALLLLLALRVHLAERASGRGRRSAVWAGLACLMRPEAPLQAGALLIDRELGPDRAPGIDGATDGRQRDAAGLLRDLLLWCGAVAAFLVPFLLFRRLYFGEWLPNTYYAKTGAGFAMLLHDGRSYTVGFLATLPPGFGSASIWAAAAGLILLIVLLAFGLPRPRLRPAALLVVGQGLAVVLEGGDWMVLHRFWVPALPPLALLLVAAGRAMALQGAGLRAAGVATGVLLVASGVSSGVRARDGTNGLAVNGEGYRFAHHEVARFLRERSRPGDTVALMDVGIIGYESGLRVLDISGLTDREIARASGPFLDKRYPVETILARSPRFFVLVDGFSIDSRIGAHPVFKGRYDLVLKRNHRFNWTPPQSYTLHVYERRDRP